MWDPINLPPESTQTTLLSQLEETLDRLIVAYTDLQQQYAALQHRYTDICESQRLLQKKQHDISHTLTVILSRLKALHQPTELTTATPEILDQMNASSAVVEHDLSTIEPLEEIT